MKNKTKPGEKVFPFILLLLGVYVTKESVKMYKMAPTLEGHGTVPLICGILLILFSIMIIIENTRAESEIKGMSAGDKLKAVVHHLFSLDVIVSLALIVIYCMCMDMGMPFVVATPLYLWLTMTYLSIGSAKVKTAAAEDKKTAFCKMMIKTLIKNVIWTVILMVFVLIVFKVIFGVVLP